MVANGTRIQTCLEPPEGWPAFLAWPGLKNGKVVYSPAEGLYVLDVDDVGSGSWSNVTRVFCPESAFVVMLPERIVVEPDGGLNEWMGPRPYDAALRIIADLHAAYGEDIGISVGRGADSDIVTLFHPGVLGEAGTVDLTITFSIFGSARLEWSGGKFDTDLGPNGYTMGIEAARVWLHQHGGKR